MARSISSATRICELAGYGNEEFNNKSINWIEDVIYPDDLAQALISMGRIPRPLRRSRNPPILAAKICF
jgi:hypothetical protein